MQGRKPGTVCQGEILSGFVLVIVVTDIELETLDEEIGFYPVSLDSILAAGDRCGIDQRPKGRDPRILLGGIDGAVVGESLLRGVGDRLEGTARNGGIGVAGRGLTYVIGEWRTGGRPALGTLHDAQRTVVGRETV